MHRRFQTTALALMTLVCLFSTSNASAIYNPQLGTFMQRDPSGTPGFNSAPRMGAGIVATPGSFIGRDAPTQMYPDGMNLYAGYHVMHGALDPTGLNKCPKDCRKCVCVKVEVSFVDNTWTVYPRAGGFRLGGRIKTTFTVDGDPKYCKFRQHENVNGKAILKSKVVNAGTPFTTTGMKKYATGVNSNPITKDNASRWDNPGKGAVVEFVDTMGMDYKNPGANKVLQVYVELNAQSYCQSHRPAKSCDKHKVTRDWQWGGKGSYGQATGNAPGANTAGSQNPSPSSDLNQNEEGRIAH